MKPQQWMIPNGTARPVPRFNDSGDRVCHWCLETVLPSIAPKDAVCIDCGNRFPVSETETKKTIVDVVPQFKAKAEDLGWLIQAIERAQAALLKTPKP